MGFRKTENGSALPKALLVNLLIFGLAGVGVFGFLSCRYGVDKTTHSITTPAKSAEAAGSSATLDLSHGVTLIDFWAPWCGPCRMQGEILKEMEPKVASFAAVQKINVDENRQMAHDYQVAAIPCLVILKDGKEVQRFVGVHDAATLEAALRKWSNG